MSLGAWEYNLLRSWIEAYSKKTLETQYDKDSNSIIVNMGLAHEFSGCRKSQTKLTMKMRSGQSYCKEIIKKDFNFDREVRINWEEFIDCANNKDLAKKSFRCLKWECGAHFRIAKCTTIEDFAF